MKALIMVDLLNDFVPGGALSVPNGNQVIPIANKLQRDYSLVVATQDWHPPNHGSFAVNHEGKKPGDRILLDGIEQILWPLHCVQETPGADFVPALDRSRIDRVFQKGTDPRIDSYSALFDNAHRRSTGLAEYLQEQSVTDVYLLGLTLDYCVKFSAPDARQLGFNTYVILDACRGIALQPDDLEKALEEMRRAGAKIV